LYFKLNIAYYIDFSVVLAYYKPVGNTHVNILIHQILNNIYK